MIESSSSMSSVEVELETLHSIYVNELTVEQDDQSKLKTISIQLFPSTADKREEQYVTMTLIVKLCEDYPDSVPEISIRNSRGLLDAQVNKIIAHLNSTAKEKLGSSMLFELIEEAKELITIENKPMEECAICLYGFHEKDVFTKTECYHYYHSHCLANYIQWQRNVPKEESKQSEEPTEEVLCPICRLPIAFSDADSKYPEPVASFEEVVMDSKLNYNQKEMQCLFKKQLAQGGIIDVDVERNKFLLEISNVDAISATLNVDTQTDSTDSNLGPTVESKSGEPTSPNLTTTSEEIAPENSVEPPKDVKNSASTSRSWYEEDDLPNERKRNSPPFNHRQPHYNNRSNQRRRPFNGYPPNAKGRPGYNNNRFRNRDIEKFKESSDKLPPTDPLNFQIGSIDIEVSNGVSEEPLADQEVTKPHSQKLYDRPYRGGRYGVSEEPLADQEVTKPHSQKLYDRPYRGGRYNRNSPRYERFQNFNRGPKYPYKNRNAVNEASVPNGSQQNVDDVVKLEPEQLEYQGTETVPSTDGNDGLLKEGNESQQETRGQNKAGRYKKTTGRYSRDRYTKKMSERIRDNEGSSSSSSKRNGTSQHRNDGADTEQHQDCIDPPQESLATPGDKGQSTASKSSSNFRKQRKPHQHKNTDSAEKRECSPKQESVGAVEDNMNTERDHNTSSQNKGSLYEKRLPGYRREKFSNNSSQWNERNGTRDGRGPSNYSRQGSYSRQRGDYRVRGNNENWQHYNQGIRGNYNNERREPGHPSNSNAEHPRYRNNDRSYFSHGDHKDYRNRNQRPNNNEEYRRFQGGNMSGRVTAQSNQQQLPKVEPTSSPSSVDAEIQPPVEFLNPDMVKAKKSSFSQSKDVSNDGDSTRKKNGTAVFRPPPGLSHPVDFPPGPNLVEHKNVAKIKAPPGFGFKHMGKLEDLPVAPDVTKSKIVTARKSSSASGFSHLADFPDGLDLTDSKNIGPRAPPGFAKKTAYGLPATVYGLPTDTILPGFQKS